jgi:hypothetical protein
MVYKNFRAPGMSKNVFFLTFLPVAPLSDAFLGYFDFPNVKKRDFFHFFPNCSLVATHFSGYFDLS